MNLGRARREEVTISLTPLIDVVFLLLIFFMVSTTFKQERDLDVTLPKTTETGAAPAIADAAIEIVITADGSYYLDETPLPGSSTEALRGALAEAAGGKRDLPVVVRADADAAHGAVVRVLDAASQVGLRHIRIATEIDRSGT